MDNNRKYFNHEGCLLDESMLAYIQSDENNELITDHLGECDRCLYRYTQLLESNKLIEKEGGTNKILEKSVSDIIGLKVDDNLKSHLQKISGEKLQKELEKLTNEELQKDLEEQFEEELKLMSEIEHKTKPIEEVEQDIQDKTEAIPPEFYETANRPPIRYMYEEFSPPDKKVEVGFIQSLLQNQYFRVVAPMTTMSIFAAFLFFNEPDKEFKRIRFELSFAVELNYRGSNDLDHDQSNGLSTPSSSSDVPVMWNKVEKNNIDDYADHIPQIDFKKDDLIVYFKKTNEETNRFIITVNDQQRITKGIAEEVRFEDFQFDEVMPIRVLIQEYKDKQPISKIDVKYIME